jgi:peptidoglycan hydrolase CwlO-like protein
MNQRVLAALVVILCMALSGCAAMRNWNGSLDRDIQKLKDDNEAYKRSLQDKDGQIDRLNKQLSTMSREIETLKTEGQQAPIVMQKAIPKAEGGEAVLKDQVSALKDKTTAVEEKAAARTAVAEMGAGAKALRLKVLSGNGKISSAQAMSKKLKALGYRVEDTGLASRTNYRVHTVYYAAGYKSQAQRIAAQLGSGTVSSPLTWPSVFNVIVVAGR